VARRIKRGTDAADNYPVPRRVPRIFAALASVAAVAALPATASAITPPRITEFAPLTLGNAPADITPGPDGNLWFTQEGAVPGIGRITPAGVITEYPAGVATGFSAGMVPKGITEGPDGALWFTEQGASDAIASIDPATGTVVEHPLPNDVDPTAITTGSDGNLWFIERGATKIGRMTPAGVHDEFNAGLSGSDTLNDITSGPDGQLWVTIEASGDNRIESFSPSNPDDPCFWSAGLTGAPNQIVAASNGKLYFTETNNPAAIGRIKTDGEIKEYTTGLTADSGPTGITEGGDAALWFAAGASPGRIGRLWPASETFQEFTAGVGLGLDLTPDSTPAGITRGPDGNVWFTETAFPGRIGRITVPPLADLDLVQAAIPDRHVIADGELKATVTANSQDTTYRVEYGPDESYGSETAELPAGNGAVPLTETVQLPLEPSSHYHARLVATNAAGEGVSSDLTLWTNAAGKISDFEPGVAVPAPTPKPKPEVPNPETPAPGSNGNAPETTPAPADIPVAPPVLGKTVVVHPVSGAVRVKAPGSRAYRPLAADARLPVGSMVDTRNGKIVLQSARDARGRTQKGTFWGGVFQIRQSRHSRGMTSLVLRGGSFRRCGTRAGISVLAHESGGRRRVVRRLWGKDKHSRFRTHGRDSVATVRGTRWVTTDRCDGTLTSVTEGKVLVRDLRRKRSVMVRAGSAYLARHRR
jgi:streptogramin lyase